MVEENDNRRTLSNLLAMRLLPHRFLATQLRKPSGRFGRWVMTRALNDGNAEMIDATLEALTLRPTERFLDVGFGGGRAITRAATQTEGALWGVDFAPDMIAAGTRTLAPLITAGRLNLIHADVTDLPLRDGIVDAICTTNTIYFWPDLPKALAELLRLLAPYGRLAVGFTGAEKMRRFESITSHGFRKFEPPGLESALKAAGFRRITTRALSSKVTRGDYVTLAHA